ncbi:MAG: ATP-binding cassette domain-containing protein [Erythrobacter sp.]|uniref:ATP-binding cassette domain-containing protein n=1 Tax=Erythrobacter sp. TaxID=1042 RepID=UPI0026241EF3|nr:ATP-binding cassette domain-containing protein [Erythrobacter sp.]MDJ0979112.1 ATP-binding cassette domain-containing protein [Erythrobacter sp.]
MAPCDLTTAVETYARARDVTLPPAWSADLGECDWPAGVDALETLRTAMSWDAPMQVEGRPQPDQLPLLLHDPDRGWLVARQWIGENELAVIGEAQPLSWSESQSGFALTIPDPLREGEPSAFGVFAKAIKRRSRVLIVAGLATVFANILTLATSLYAMQLYDRVIPLASFETLIVLTVGVVFALLLDLALRSLRAMLIETEAQNIDKEVSEFFFARAQAIRLDARPKGIGTMAAQIQGQEQIRQVMSASSLFVFADLPFALLFIAVIAGIGGSVALVPIVSLPIAMLMAFAFASIIRKGAERAQVTGNQKNGLLVEMLDASETIKANLGAWQMIGRWNKLIREIHHYEDPVKRASAVSGSLFSSLQQASYVAVMGYGAYLAATGRITTGGLLACSIIVGRINGPLIAQLPALIVQWGYARSSLKALDALMQHPVERTAASAALRPADLDGPLVLKDVSYAYDQGAPALDIDRLAFAPGERIAIVGGVGAGKSTLLKVAAGLYAPQSGAVSLAGYNLAHLAEDVIRRRIGYLSQSSRLVTGTLREALCMGLAHVSDDTLTKTARATGLESLFGERQPGLDALVQEGGTGLSGGQRALVGLNRLLHQRPRVWLLDEPTAALDLASEKLALDYLESALGESDTLVMATHKVDLLARFTRVVVIARGAVISDQSAEQFLRKVRERRDGAGAPSASASTSAARTITTQIRSRGGR